MNSILQDILISKRIAITIAQWSKDSSYFEECEVEAEDYEIEEVAGYITVYQN